MADFHKQDLMVDTQKSCVACSAEVRSEFEKTGHMVFGTSELVRSESTVSQTVVHRPHCVKDLGHDELVDCGALLGIQTGLEV